MSALPLPREYESKAHSGLIAESEVGIRSKVNRPTSGQGAEHPAKNCGQSVGEGGNDTPEMQLLAQEQAFDQRFCVRPEGFEPPTY